MINDKKIYRTIRHILKEYSADQRLPFDDDRFKNKNYLEQYTDWLEDFGRYGTLPPSKLKFLDGVKDGIKKIVQDKLLPSRKAGVDVSSEREILNEFAHIAGKNLILTDGNKIYVERMVVIDDLSSSYDETENGKDPKMLFRTLVSNYQNNVGGCWCYKKGGSESYCAMKGGSSVIMKGYIRIDDIDFVKTVLLNFQYRSEHEIRVKPNAKVELFEVIFDCKYKAPLKGHLIVNATYFGNNAGYSGDYATVDDGLGNFSFVDRNGKIIDYNKMIDIINSKLLNGVKPESIFDDVVDLGDGIKKVFFLEKCTFIDTSGKLACDGKILFDNVRYKIGNVVIVELKDKYSFVTIDGKLIGNGKLWFDDISPFSEGLASVSMNGKYSVIDTKGNLIKGGKLWFDYISYFHDGFAIVKLNKKYSFIDKEGNLIGDGKQWFDKVSNFKEGFAQVNLNGKWSFIGYYGKLIGNGKLWFDFVTDFDDGFATVQYNGELYSVDENGNLKKLGSMNDIVNDLKDYFKENKHSNRNILTNVLNEIINEEKNVVPKSFINSLNKFKEEYKKISEYTESEFPMLDMSSGVESFYKIEDMSIENNIWQYRIVYDDYHHTKYEENILLSLYDDDYGEYYFNEEAKMYLSDLKKDLKRGLKYFKEYNPDYDDNEEKRDEFLNNI